MGTRKNTDLERNLEPEWVTPSSRLAWLVATKFGGNRSAFATAVGVSHTIVGKVCGGQPPGRKLLTAVSQRLGVDAGWLLTGLGQPFPHDAVAPLSNELPVATRPLPGHPSNYPGWIAEAALDIPYIPFNPGMYWLVLQADQPIVRNRIYGFRLGDRLLMLADPAAFPGPSHLRWRLCAVKVGGSDEPILVTVTYYPAELEDGPERLEAELFTPPVDPLQPREEVYVHLSGGRVEHYTRLLRSVPFRGQNRLAPDDNPTSRWNPVEIQYREIVGVWSGVLHRTPGI